MSSTIHISVELKFCLGYLMPGTPNPNPNTTKFVNFPISKYSISKIFRGTFLRNDNGSRITPSQLLTEHSDLSAPTSLRNSLGIPAARSHIGNTLQKADLPYNNHQNQLGDLDHWVIGTDASINTNFNLSPQYFRYPMKITSPALPFNQESLASVRKVCNILTNEYLTDVNVTCVLHVHFSFGRDFRVDDETTRWDFKRLKKLMMFFWTFEPQFDTIRPDYRINDVTEQTISMRRYSLLGLRLASSPRESRLSKGLEEIVSTRDLPQLVDLVSGEDQAREMVVSIYHVTRALNPYVLSCARSEECKKKPDKPTVEFRQHEGTVEGERVECWIRTLGGVILWLDDKDVDVDPDILMNLMHDNVGEWKTARGRIEREDKGPEARDTYGIGDGGESFTIVDLLKRLRLEEEAELYRRRLASQACDLKTLNNP